MNTDEEAIALKLCCVDLLFDCPRQSCKSNCPFAPVRAQQDIVARVNWLKQRNIDELRNLVAHHATCAETPSISGNPF
jgi:hypothetical protein